MRYNKISSKEIIEQTMALEPDERFMINESLIKSLDQPDRKIDEIWAEEAGKRLKAYRYGILNLFLWKRYPRMNNENRFLKICVTGIRRYNTFL